MDSVEKSSNVGSLCVEGTLVRYRKRKHFGNFAGKRRKFAASTNSGLRTNSQITREGQHCLHNTLNTEDMENSFV